MTALPRGSRALGLGCLAFLCLAAAPAALAALAHYWLALAAPRRAFLCLLSFRLFYLFASSLAVRLQPGDSTRHEFILGHLNPRTSRVAFIFRRNKLWYLVLFVLFVPFVLSYYCIDFRVRAGVRALIPAPLLAEGPWWDAVGDRVAHGTVLGRALKIKKLIFMGLGALPIRNKQSFRYSISSQVLHESRYSAGQ